MASKALLVLCVLLAIALLVSSREVPEKHDEKKVKEHGLHDKKHEGYPGGGRHNYPGGGGGYPDDRGGYNRGGPGGGGGRGKPFRARKPPIALCPYCSHGCCRPGNNCCICCSSADEISDAQYLAEPPY